jgi:hypothetical protein
MESLGEKHFTVTREEVMASSIYGDYGDVRDILELVEWIENQGELNRIYSTYESWNYIRN